VGKVGRSSETVSATGVQAAVRQGQLDAIPLGTAKMGTSYATPYARERAREREANPRRPWKLADTKRLAQRMCTCKDPWTVWNIVKELRGHYDLTESELRDKVIAIKVGMEMAGTFTSARGGTTAATLQMLHFDRELDIEEFLDSGREEREREVRERRK
jgi:hypothetical protein